MTSDFRPPPLRLPKLAAEPETLTLIVRRAKRRRRREAYMASASALVVVTGTILAAQGLAASGSRGGVELQTPAAAASSSTSPQASSPPSSSPSPASPSPSPSESASNSSQLSLVSGPYGFLVPDGWAAAPLSGHGGSSRATTFTDPTDAAYFLSYQQVGGSLSEFYTSGSSPQPRPTGYSGGQGCLTVTSISAVGQSAAQFTCQQSSPGVETRGVVVVAPYPQGAQIVIVTLPTSDDSSASQIIGSVH